MESRLKDAKGVVRPNALAQLQERGPHLAWRPVRDDTLWLLWCVASGLVAGAARLTVLRTGPAMFVELLICNQKQQSSQTCRTVLTTQVI
jgi:hypothetical protein